MTQLMAMRDALIKAGYSREAVEAALQERITLHDQYTMAALTGLLACGHASPHHCDAVAWARHYADEALKQRLPHD